MVVILATGWELQHKRRQKSISLTEAALLKRTASIK
jgi:hypothetical protein